MSQILRSERRTGRCSIACWQASAITRSVAIVILFIAAHSCIADKPVGAQADSDAADAIPATKQALAKHISELTIDDVVAGLRANEARLQNMSCAVSSSERNYYFDDEGNPPPKDTVENDAIETRRLSIGDWVADTAGRSWVKRTIKTTTFRVKDSALVEVRVNESSFDGVNGIQLSNRKLSDSTWRMYAQFGDGLSFHEGPAPLEFTTHWLRLPISSILAQGNGRVVGVETSDEWSLIVAEKVPVKHGAEYKTQFWIDPARGFAVVRRCAYARNDPNAKWFMQMEANSFNLKEVAPGIWLPSNVELKRQVFLERINAVRNVTEEKGRFTDWRVNQHVPDSQFHVNSPDGTPVREIRRSRIR